MSVDVTCDCHGLRETLFLYTIYMTVAMTPLSILACPMSHQFVGGCDSHGLRETLFLCTTYMTVAMTPLSVLACPMSHQFVGGCDMWQSWSEGDSTSM